MTQIRKLLDEMKVTRFFGRPAKEYENPRINEFFQQVALMVWELTDIEELTEKEYLTYNFYRDPTPPQRRPSSPARPDLYCEPQGRSSLSK
ncbi:MAG: hypothetical protein R3C11_24365 [Planctomycetaceae bacterium]